MRVLIFAPYYWPAVKAGGPVRSLTNLSEHLALSNEVLVIARDRDLDDSEAFAGGVLQEASKVNPRVRYVNFRSLKDVLSYVSELRGEKYDVVILNSIWSVGGSFVPAVLVALRCISSRQVVLMPRGELEKGVMSQKAAKKRLAALVVKAVYGTAASAVAVTSDSEAANARQWFPGKKILRTTNLPDRLSPGYERGDGAYVRLLVLGRIHPTKGLMELIRAMGDVRVPISLMIAGPIEDGAYWAACQTMLRRLPSFHLWTYVGIVDRSEVGNVLRRSDILVTLTSGENFGHTIAESLQVGCPVVVTTNTPWTQVVGRGGGWLVSDRNDRVAVVGVLEQACQDIRKSPASVRERAVDAYREWEAKMPLDPVSILFPQA